MEATSSTHFVWPAAENGMLFVSLGNWYLGDGHDVGQFVSTTSSSLPHALAMLARLLFKAASVALGL